MHDLVERAREFATRKHAEFGQVRKYTGSPYITHPAHVVELLLPLRLAPSTIAGAWLHDVVEDCEVSFDYLFDTFGFETTNVVYWMTNVSKKADGNRRQRFKIDKIHQSKAPMHAKTVRLADIIDNVRDMHQHDPEFAAVYLREKREMLEVLGAGHPTLMAQATYLIEHNLSLLGAI